MLHQHEWLGPIAPLIETAFVKFDQGFVSSCALKAVTETQTPSRHPAWVKVRTFSATEKSPRSLIDHLLQMGAKRISRRPNRNALSPRRSLKLR